MILVSGENLSLGYGGKTLARVTFELEAGDYLVVLGENGAGKTTFLKTLLGLQEPLNGKITLHNGLRRTEIGYMPQQTTVQRDFPATIWEIVLSGCQGRAGWRPFYNQQERALTRQNLERLGLQAYVRRSYKELSGGQQQRVLLARALGAAQKVLVLDEPVAGLDAHYTRVLYSLLSELKQQGLTVIMISHDREEALADATKVLAFEQGQVFFGTKGAYLQSRGQASLEEKLGRAGHGICN